MPCRARDNGAYHPVYTGEISGVYKGGGVKTYHESRHICRKRTDGNVRQDEIKVGLDT